VSYDNILDHASGSALPASPKSGTQVEMLPERRSSLAALLAASSMIVQDLLIRLIIPVLLHDDVYPIAAEVRRAHLP
jgi:hypothetical protein